MEYTASTGPNTVIIPDTLVAPTDLEDKFTYVIWADTARWNSWSRWLESQSSSTKDKDL